ncbi:MAG: hypothetical protein H6960_09835 [Chromatiaceae bacterium]|nr:hypothetical protein [Chromatiaceae bacterium]
MMRNTWALGGGLLIVGSIAVCGQAFAQPFGLMFERDNDVASNELGFNTYATYADILTANATSSTFSNINVNAPFSTTGITWDGSQFIVMFERDNDVTSNELGFNTYATYADILTANATSSTFSNINVNAPFSTTGITWDGSQFIVMFERDNDVTSNELGFNTYATYADILTANATSSTFSNINVNAPFSTTGITWDGSQFIVMFERDNDVTSNELGFNTYATYADILTANATSSTFSNINVNAPFSTTGIYFVGDDQGDQQVPGPTPILLMSPVLAGLVFRRVRSQKGSG